MKRLVDLVKTVNCFLKALSFENALYEIEQSVALNPETMRTGFRKKALKPELIKNTYAMNRLLALLGKNDLE